MDNAPDAYSIIYWFCAAIALGGALAATLLSDIRRAILAVWITGLGVGGLYLSLGTELLAVVQWVLSTLIAVASVFYAVLFGEYGVSDSRPFSKKLLSAALPFALGLGFVTVLVIGARSFPGLIALGLHGATPPGPVQQDLAAVGRGLADDHLLALELLALTLFLVIVGGGVIVRPESQAKVKDEGAK